MPAGRPMKLNSPVGRAADGKTLTVRSVILDWLGKGYPQAVAIGRAGVSSSTMNTWLRRGASVSEKLMMNPSARLEPDERDLLVFVRQVDTAVAEAHGRYWEKVSDLALGGLTRTKLTVKTERRPNPTTGAMENVEIERTQQVEQMLPALPALTYVLAQQYGHRKDEAERIEDGALTDDEAITQLGDAMERWLSTHNADDPQATELHELPTNGSGNGETPSH